MRKSSPKSIFGRKIFSHRLKDDRLPRPPDHQILEIFPAIFGRRERNLLEDMGRGGLRRHKRQLHVIDDPVHGPEFRDESDDLRRPLALGADHRVNLIEQVLNKSKPYSKYDLVPKIFILLQWIDIFDLYTNSSLFGKKEINSSH